MKTFRSPVVALGLAGVAALAGGLLALQEGTRFPGERRATSTLVVDAVSGEEIRVQYNTLQFGPAAVKTMMAATGEDRDRFASVIPRRLRGTFESAVALAIGDDVLAAGKYELSFVPNDDDGVSIRFLQEGQTVLEAALEMREGGDEHDFLGFNLRSAGAEEFRLDMDYGSVKASLPMAVSWDDDEAEEDDDGE